MAELAIKGHKTRGKEVIEILEMLGGKNVYFNGSGYKRAYFIRTDGYIDTFQVDLSKAYQVFTLEEFLEKFPYKVGDKVFAFGNKCTVIGVVWDGSVEEVVYTISLDTNEYTTTKLSNQLQPYKELETSVNFNSMTPVENIKEELYKWYPVVDEGEYWTDYDTAVYRDGIEKISTIVTNGKDVWTRSECNLGWGTMAKQGNWKYMRIKLD